ncbi:hypothetical protein C8F04DRAFT_1082819 [Mycena alexandri]|uniref:Uncharacterized protein n=1 Tax=Mycena alexandri TaxID=1745969 RepID=A0AAD6X6A4_9AGAR|nr:hypothetical protein C8F04DRAFT_1082819 [Mycena alexandri]
MDPITPIQSGLRISSLMPDSTRIIIQDGPGHCSDAVRVHHEAHSRYFAGILPENGIMCDTPCWTDIGGCKIMGIYEGE